MCMFVFVCVCVCVCLCLSVYLRLKSPPSAMMPARSCSLSSVTALGPWFTKSVVGLWGLLPTCVCVVCVCVSCVFVCVSCVCHV